MEEVENAIKLDPNSEARVVIQDQPVARSSKLAEMDGKTDQKAELDKQREAAQKRTNELSEAEAQEEEGRRGRPKATPARVSKTLFRFHLLVVMLD